MAYLYPTQPLSSRRLSGMRGLRGLGQSPYSPPPPMPGPPQAQPPGLPPGWDTGYPTSDMPPVAVFTPSSGAPATPGFVPVSSVTPSASPQGLQVNTILTYRAQISLAGLLNTMSSLQQLVAKVSQRLSNNWGIKVTNTILPPTLVDMPGLILTKSTGQPQPLTLTVQLGMAYGTADDVLANINHEMMNVFGGSSIVSSGIVVSGSAFGGAAPVGETASPSWFSQNWPWVVGGGAAGLFLIKDLL